MATAFDEVNVLDQKGREGWEMSGFGPLVLHVRRPDDPAVQADVEPPRRGSNACER